MYYNKSNYTPGPDLKLLNQFPYSILLYFIKILTFAENCLFIQKCIFESCNITQHQYSGIDSQIL